MAYHDLKNKVALITGVSRQQGIGAAIARELSKAGVQIFTTYFRPYDKKMPWKDSDDDAAIIIEELKSNGVKADGIEMDLRDSKAPALVLDAAEKSFGQVDILINNATSSIDANVYNLTPDY